MTWISLSSAPSGRCWIQRLAPLRRPSTPPRPMMLAPMNIVNQSHLPQITSTSARPQQTARRYFCRWRATLKTRAPNCALSCKSMSFYFACPRCQGRPERELSMQQPALVAAIPSNLRALANECLIMAVDSSQPRPPRLCLDLQKPEYRLCMAPQPQLVPDYRNI